MSSPRFVLCLVLLASGLGLAQTPGSPLPPETELPPPPLVPAPTSPPPIVPAPAPAEPEAPAPEGELIPRAEEPRAPTSPRFAPGRVVLESLGGVVGGVGLGLGSALVIGGLFSLSSDCDGESACGLLAGILALPAIAVGIPLGVYAAGGLLDGEGRFLPALGGMFAGVGASLLLGATGNGLVTGLGIAILPIAGAVIGYELSHTEYARTTRDTDGYEGGYASTGLQMAPLLGISPRGGFVGGMWGRF